MAATAYFGAAQPAGNYAIRLRGRVSRWLHTVALAIVISACGGGGSESTVLIYRMTPWYERQEYLALKQQLDQAGLGVEWLRCGYEDYAKTGEIILHIDGYTPRYVLLTMTVPDAQRAMQLGVQHLRYWTIEEFNVNSDPFECEPPT